ncbi:MAG TPA: SH3 domain-containing protein, partial [Candidatus Scybalocola faecavium]|nr:SH3 domain-containing protein [Candidatus Scybalocola faecavium]
MKRLAYFLAAAVLAAEIAVASPAQAYGATTGVVNTAALNVRTGASTSYSRLGLIYEGASVTILGTSGNWYKVSCSIGGSLKTGYVHKSYINVSGGATTGSSVSSGSGKVNVSALNIRSSASTSSRVLGLVYRGTQVNILEASGDWYKVSVTISGTSVTGYAYGQYITQTGSSGSGSTSSGSGSSSGSTSSGNTSASAGSKGKVNTSALNVRTGASTSASRLGCIYLNQEVTILGASGDWYQVSASVNGTVCTGYVSAQYITIVSSGNGSGTTSGSADTGNTSVAGSRGTVNAGPLNVRSGPSTGYSIYGYVNKGTVVQIVSTENGWYKVNVTLNGRTVTGYVSAQYVTVSSDS